MRQWARRASALRDELAEVADVSARRWWLLAGTAAIDWRAAHGYVSSDAEPASDTFIGHAADAPHDPVADAIARSHAARRAILKLDGTLPDQPLAVTVARTEAGAHLVESDLAVAAFAIGARCFTARLADRIDHELDLARDLRAVLAGGTPRVIRPLDAGERRTGSSNGAIGCGGPFVCVAIGEERGATARHAHRRAWTDAGGPWLGLSRADGMAIATTCHLAVDGYGHARLAARIHELANALVDLVPHDGEGHANAWAMPHGTGDAQTSHASHNGTGHTSVAGRRNGRGVAIPALAPVAGAVPLAFTWRALPPGLRSLPLAYALGCELHRLADDREARFSPTIQIPISPGSLDEPNRLRKRVIPALSSVRFEAGAPEPFEVFAARTKRILVREAGGIGVMTRMRDALRALPTPLVWKRRMVAAERPGVLDAFGLVLGGRGCVSRIELDVPSPPACAVSSPARMATAADPLGGCVVTVVDDGERAAITLCGAGAAAADEVLDELLARVPRR